MDKQQKLKIALPILVISMAFVWGPVITGSGSKTEKGNKTNNANIDAGNQGSSADLISLASANERRKAKTSHTDWGRNPFSLSAGPKPSVLEGIMWDAQNPKAIINGDILGVGDSVGTGTIVDIQQDSVIIKTGDQEKEYRLGQ